LPGVRLIYLVRDPIERLQSMYVDMLAYGGETRAIDEAVRADPDYVLTSCYGYQLEPFVEHTGTANLLVISAAKLSDDRFVTMREIYRFLGIDDDYLPAGIDKDINTRAEKRVARRVGRRLLRNDRYRSLVDADARWSRLHHACLTRPPRTSDVELSADVLAEIGERFAEDGELLRSLLGHDPLAST
ncbi:MAG: sulfotransferase domain-containing protein, partial [Acidimicrobiia bacterium]|nr:sulfotransferase domain-containing protein [Acidimicrobiia bacterium]